MVIKQYGLINEQLTAADGPLYGIPYPGVYVCDEQGVVTSKFFHDSYKKRESPEMLIDAALGEIQIDESAPRATSADDGIEITAALHGGNGSLRQGIVRQLVVSFDLPEGLHIYGEPVPQGLDCDAHRRRRPRRPCFAADGVTCDSLASSRFDR